MVTGADICELGWEACIMNGHWGWCLWVSLVTDVQPPFNHRAVIEASHCSSIFYQPIYSATIYIGSLYDPWLITDRPRETCHNRLWHDLWPGEQVNASPVLSYSIRQPFVRHSHQYVRALWHRPTHIKYYSIFAATATHITTTNCFFC